MTPFCKVIVAGFLIALLIDWYARWTARRSYRAGWEERSQACDSTPRPILVSKRFERLAYRPLANRRRLKRAHHRNERKKKSFFGGHS